MAPEDRLRTPATEHQGDQLTLVAQEGQGDQGAQGAQRALGARGAQESLGSSGAKVVRGLRTTRMPPGGGRSRKSQRGQTTLKSPSCRGPQGPPYSANAVIPKNSGSPLGALELTMTLSSY